MKTYILSAGLAVLLLVVRGVLAKECVKAKIHWRCFKAKGGNRESKKQDSKHLKN